MEGFFKKALSPFVEFDEKKEGSKETATEVVEQPEAQVMEEPEQTKRGLVDNKVLEHLEKVITDANLEGFDYFEYALAVDKMKGTEESRYANAFVAAQSTGCTKEELLKTADYYKKILKEEAENFKKALEEKRSSTIGSAEKELTALEQSISDMYKEVERLKGQITKDEDRVATLRAEVGEQKERFDNRLRSFETTVKTVQDTIEVNKERITKYIQES